jgi:rifampicin phosphotransferase
MDRWICDEEPSARYPFYTRANAGEVVPDPVSPLTWSLTWEPGVRLGWYDTQINVGTCSPDELEPHEVTGVFGGYLFINASLARLFGVRGPGLTPEAIDLAYFGTHPDVPVYVPEPWHENEEATAKLGAWIGGVIMADDLPALREDRTLANQIRADRPDLSKLSDEALVACANELVPHLRTLFARHLDVTAGASIGPGVLNAVAAAMGDPTIALKLISSVGDVDSFLPSEALWKLSRTVRSSLELTREFNAGHVGLAGRLRTSREGDVVAFIAAFDEFLATFGSRGPNEWELRSEVWETKPDLPLALVDRMRGSHDSDDPSSRSHALVADREALAAGISTALADQPETLGQFQAGLRSAHVYLQARERAKTNIIKVVHEIRMLMRELGSRHGYSLSGITMLMRDELDAFVADPSEFRVRLASREQQYLDLFDLVPPFIVNGTVPPLNTWERRSTDTLAKAVKDDVLTGVPGCPGVAIGRARVILDPADPFALEPGDVLIAPVTDPAWTPLFVPAAAVVVDVGAQVSHAIIVSRELGIPCVVSLTDGTRRIRDGALVRVDGSAGTVTILD